MTDEIYWSLIVLAGAALVAAAMRLIVASPVFHNVLYHVADFFLTRIEERFAMSHVSRKGGDANPGWRPPQ